MLEFRALLHYALTLAAAILISHCEGAIPQVINGSFENGPNPVLSVEIETGSTNIVGWTILSGNIDYSSARWKAADGHRSIDINGSNAGCIAQEIDGFEPNQYYELSFGLAINPESSPTSASVVVEIDSVANRFYVTKTGSKTTPDWSRHRIQFRATQPKSPLRITSLTGGWAGALLDSFQIRPIQTPTNATTRTITYDLERDSSIDLNPAGVWRYGWSSTIGGPLTLLEARTQTMRPTGAQYTRWSPDERNTPSISIRRSETLGASSSTSATNRLPNLIMTPGESEPDSATKPAPKRRFAVCRFVTPLGHSGNYQIDLTATLPTDSPTNATSELHLVVNGDEHFGRLVRFGELVSWTHNQQLKDGDVVDFVCGRGITRSAERSKLVLSATISRLAE